MQKQNNEKLQGNQSAPDLGDYLEYMHLCGTALFVDNEAVLPGEAVRRTVREDCLYMADYVLGESGKIEQIRFDRLSDL